MNRGFTSPQQDYDQVARATLPYLITHDIPHKIVGNPDSAERIISHLNQTGKGITINPRNKAEFERVATDLSKILHNKDLVAPNASGIQGDRPLGKSGRLFYRLDKMPVETDGKITYHYVPANAPISQAHLFKGMDPKRDDPFWLFDPDSNV